MPRLVCLLGAECTGKTTLVQALAKHFSGLSVGECLRDFCVTHARAPKAHEQAGLIDAQLALEEAALARAAQSGQRWVFCDTAPLLTAVYSDHYFADRNLYARALALHQHYALTLLLTPDLRWVGDGLQRDGVSTRAAVHGLLQRALTTVSQVKVISGQGAARTHCAVAAVQSLGVAVP